MPVCDTVRYQFLHLQACLPALCTRLRIVHTYVDIRVVSYQNGTTEIGTRLKTTQRAIENTPGWWCFNQFIQRWRRSLVRGNPTYGRRVLIPASRSLLERSTHNPLLLGPLRFLAVSSGVLNRWRRCVSRMKVHPDASSHGDCQVEGGRLWYRWYVSGYTAVI